MKFREGKSRKFEIIVTSKKKKKKREEDENEIFDVNAKGSVRCMRTKHELFKEN